MLTHWPSTHASAPLCRASAARPQHQALSCQPRHPCTTIRLPLFEDPSDVLEPYQPHVDMWYCTTGTCLQEAGPVGVEPPAWMHHCSCQCPAPAPMQPHTREPAQRKRITSIMPLAGVRKRTRIAAPRQQQAAAGPQLRAPAHALSCLPVDLAAAGILACSRATQHSRTIGAGTEHLAAPGHTPGSQPPGCLLAQPC